MQAIPLCNLKPAYENIRVVKPDSAAMKSLLASIKSQGLLHNLLVVPMGNLDNYEVIDGNRRLTALRKIHGKSSDIEIPCHVLDSDNHFDQQAIGLHANMMREGMHPLDECDVINRLCSMGTHDYDSCAKQFGQTRRWVEQRVALTELSETARARFRNCDFNIGVASALTLGSYEQQDAFLEKYGPDIKITPDLARNAMIMNKVPVSKALFEVTKEIELDLGVEGDLFGDEKYFTNLNGFQSRQHEVVEATAQSYRDMGFQRVDVLYDQYPWEHREYKNLNRLYDVENPDDLDQFSTVVVVIYNSNRFSMETQYLVDKQALNQAELEAAEEGEPAELTLADMSNPQRSMFEQMKAHAVREWLLKNKPEAFLAMVTEAAYHSYTRTYTTRASDVTFNIKPEFHEDLTPEWYKENEIYVDADKLHDTVAESYEDVDRHPLDYFLGNGNDWLFERLLPIIARSIPTHVLNDQRILDAIEFTTPTDGWFKPDAKFLSKYKVSQLYTLYCDVLGKKPLQDQSKKAYIDAILTVFANTDVTFDPMQEATKD